MFGKLANVYPDLSSKSLSDTQLFRQLTGGDTIRAQKKFRGKFEYINHAKLIFSTNRIPQAYDDTAAFFRRWIFITFPNRFDDNSANKNLINEITTEKELSGIFNWALEGLYMWRQTKLVVPKAVKQAIDHYRTEQDTTGQFIQEMCKLHPQLSIEKKALYESYKACCQ